ncbi:hypothetical protein [Anaerofustis butyriciformans]|uniref:hypothetical protein n=1 Tax=Anaerofustis butyriciformans TaxID=3108533 RepID=UPI002E30F4D8|nr:hypothetical protein [Anaerofustis sp. HA2171]
MDNENNKDYLNEEKGEFIVNKKIDEEVKEELNTKEEKGEFIVNKKPIEEENSNIKEDNNTKQDENINTSNNYEQNVTKENSKSNNLEKEVEKVKEKNNKLAIFSVIGGLAIALLVLIAIFNGTFNTSYVDYAYKGIEVNKYFEISPENLAYTIDFVNKEFYQYEYNETKLPTIEELTFDEEKEYYEKVIMDGCDFKIKVYPSDNNKKIEKIEFSYNWMYFYDRPEKEHDDFINIFSGYINMTQYSMWGNVNYENEISNKLWNKLNSIEYKYTYDGIPYGKISYEDEKALYEINNTKECFVIFTITPNNK